MPAKKNQEPKQDAKQERQQEPGAKPMQVFRLKGVRVSVFKNRARKDDGEVTYYKTSLTRVYKDEGSDEWKSTTSLSRDDLPIAQLLLGRAWEWILDTEARSKESEEF